MKEKNQGLEFEQNNENWHKIKKSFVKKGSFLERINHKKDSDGEKIRKITQKTQPESKFHFLKSILVFMKVDWDSTKLKFHRFPASVNIETKLLQVHYLFQMLGIGVVFVVNDSNELYGKITIEEFINLRYMEEKELAKRNVKMEEYLLPRKKIVY